ncbi:MAG TPA: FAD-dependent oxidoreductase [Xanthobacteraceae bacterium]|nr:FAD-dependent oxidoreductase [Xanthobacteraceae bacterium]
MATNIVVIGGGPAGVWAAIEAKRRDATAEVVLVTDEACEPYEKPPLSKTVLLGKARPEDAPIAGKSGLAAHHVVLKTNARCNAIDRAGRKVVTDAGALPYDALVIATGSLMREMPLLPIGMKRVHYLRTDVDALALKADLATCKHLVVIGAGLIGLEVAASALALGVKPTVIELAPRVMARMCDEETGAFVQSEHQRRGVDIRLNTAITQVAPQTDGRIALKTSAGDELSADLVVVGTGVKPNDALAAAGLTVQDGIVVDEQCRTSDPAIFAAGDVTRFPGPHGLARLENWRHGQDHGAIAGRNAAGANDAYRAVPSCWTEQYDLYIQAVGWMVDMPQRVKRPMAGKSMLSLELDGALLSYAVGVNAQKDLAAVRRLIERRIPVDASALADPNVPFAAMLKAKA